MAKYSIAVPFHNEEENVTILYARLKQVMEQVGDSFELVFVDDGSTDRTYKLLEEIAAVDSRVLIVKPVSYTHLDVYKRQVQRGENQGWYKGQVCGSQWARNARAAPRSFPQH